MGNNGSSVPRKDQPNMPNCTTELTGGYNDGSSVPKKNQPSMLNRAPELTDGYNNGSSVPIKDQPNMPNRTPELTSGYNDGSSNSAPSSNQTPELVYESFYSFTKRVFKNHSKNSSNI